MCRDNRHWFFRMRLIVTAAVGLSAIGSAQTWKALWSDEFDSTTAGAPPDASKWVYDTGAGKWGNKELETYCAPGASTPAPCDPRNPNVFQDGKGHLVIQAIRSSAGPAPTGTWTSGRIKTRGIQDFQYGRMEACMRLPVGPGLWPAFWLLGTVGPGFTGEIDIMENVPDSGQKGGLGPTIIETTIHGARPDGPHNLFSLAKDLTLPNGGRIDNAACHIYGAIWSPFMIQVYVDDWRSPFFIRTASDFPPGGKWVFSAPNRFYFLFNLAVGAIDTGNPLDASVADFSTSETQSARITFKTAADSGGGLAAGTYSLSVTAYTVSGDQSTIAVPVVVN
jgi:beta-glucanase (GH16 family)